MSPLEKVHLLFKAYRYSFWHNLQEHHFFALLVAEILLEISVEEFYSYVQVGKLDDKVVVGRGYSVQVGNREHVPLLQTVQNDKIY